MAYTTNAWGWTAPGPAGPWGPFFCGGAWTCQHLWEHYAFTRDRDYLKRAYPVLKGASVACLHMLVDDENGRLITSPSTSPENRFRTDDGQTGWACEGSAAERQIIWDLFNNTAQAAKILGIEEEFRKQLETAKAKIRPPEIGRGGQLMEWGKDWDLNAPEPRHRHISHLYALHPGHQISPLRTPDLANAARTTLDMRGDASTGWSQAWKINCWARLHDGDRAYKLIREQLKVVDSTGTDYMRGGGTYADRTAGFVAGCYAAFPQFDLFTSLSMVYFAAASYCEMARRLGRNHLAQHFLAVDHPSFATVPGRLSQILRHNHCFDSILFTAQVKEQIDPLNVAGLCDQRKRNWYDVDLEDVILRAEKLEITPEEMRRFLKTASWAQTAINLDQYRLQQYRPKQQAQTTNRLLAYRDQLLDEPEPPGEMVGSSPVFQQVIEDALNVAPTDTTVLLRGETGTGKELVAYAIHRHSQRSHRPFVIVNCAALPASLIESELFGYEKGAFTGALLRKPGRFELADGGTIFLDEIGEVPLEVQGRFLRVLQTGVFERLGSTKSVRVKVRIIAATNQPLEQLVNEGRFRIDLYYRLNIFPITLPPLRRRPADIPLLVRHFVDKYNARFNRTITSISKQSLHALQEYHWPGNIRELEHLVERAVLSAKSEILKVAPPAISIEPPLSVNDEPAETVSAGANKDAIPIVSLADNERDHIRMVLLHTRGQISGPQGAAAILGLPPSTLRSRIKKLGLKIHLDDRQ